MATSFPTGLDSYTRPLSTDLMNSPSHSGVHENAYDAIESLEAKVGIDSSAVTTSHDYKLSLVTGTNKAVPQGSSALTQGSVLFAGSGGAITQDNPGFTYVIGTGLSLDDKIIVTGTGRFDGGITDSSDLQSLDSNARVLNAPNGDEVFDWSTADVAEFNDAIIQTNGDVFFGNKIDLGAVVNIQPTVGSDLALGIRANDSQISDIMLIRNSVGDLIRLAFDAQMIMTIPNPPLDIQNTSDTASNKVMTFRGGNRATPANNDELFLSFTLDDSNGNQAEFGRINVVATDVTNTTKDGMFQFEVMNNNSLVNNFEIRSTAVVINEDSNDVNFRVESLNNIFMLVVDSGTDEVLIGTGTPLGAALGIIPHATTDVGIIVKGKASQTADIIQALNSSGSKLFGVEPDGDVLVLKDLEIDGALNHDGTLLGFYGTTPAAQSAAYTRNATIVEDRTLLASASATTLNNNNVLAALIADLQSIGLLG